MNKRIEEEGSKKKKKNTTLPSLVLSCFCATFLQATTPTVVHAQAEQANGTQAVDLNSYLKQMGRIFSSSWIGGQPDKSRQAIVEFTLHSNGAVSDAKISKSSGSALIDKEAVETVEKAKLPAMPSGSAPETDVNFTFRLNLYE